MRQIFMAGLAAFALSGCMTVAKTTGKAVTLPFKATYHTGKMVGKGAFATGKGVYYVGSVPVKISDKALDSTTKVLVVTTKLVDLTGKVVVVSRHINAAQLDSELSNIKRAKNVISVLVDAYA